MLVTKVNLILQGYSKKKEKKKETSFFVIVKCYRYIIVS